MKRKPAQSKRPAAPRRRPIAKAFPGQQYRIIADREGGLPIPEEMAREANINIGDEYAVWKVRDAWHLVFLKDAKPGVVIPKRAERRKVEPALPEIPVSAPPAPLFGRPSKA